MSVLIFFMFISLRFFNCYGDYVSAENINVFLFGSEKFEFVDLSYGFQVNYLDCKISEIDGYSNICVNDRLGTEIDANYNNANVFGKQQIVGNIPLKNLIVPLIIADVSDKVNGNENFVLYKEHLDYFLNNYFGAIHQPCLMIFKFGWSKYFNDRRKYCGSDSNNSTWKYPGLSEEVAQWIITSYKNIVGVGVDLPTLDPGSSNMMPAMKTLINAGIYTLKNVKLDQYLPEASCTALVTPPRMDNAGSSPLRLIAICPKSRMQKPQILLHHL
ncbi:uncharacterized protein LOC131847831 [Achroia grisella]|uniref:uncharacterized protein LOC131847831 n=1 Tax=Achroia grisella TaxID=688607 RepID=UPI0027D21417|nr:uncharacterized protein LOC131847831 [Achroia grisella]